VIGVNDVNLSPKAEPATPCLAMRPREAAKALGISERLLWQWTNMGLVPHIRIGKVVLYPVNSLREWLKRRAQTTATDAGSNSEKNQKET